MATIHLHATTTATPEQFVAGLTDFGPGRQKLFPNSADGDLKVHDQGPTSADVTEGSRGIWERLHYDWSDPAHVVMTTTDSNTWGGDSSHTYTFTRNPDGTTDVDVVVVREGKNLKGRMLGVVLGSVGKGQLVKAFRTTVKAIEARSNGARIWALLESAHRTERRAQLGGEELRLLPGGEVAPTLSLVEVGEPGVDRLDPATRHREDLAGERA